MYCAKSTKTQYSTVTVECGYGRGRTDREETRPHTHTTITMSNLSRVKKACLYKYKPYCSEPRLATLTMAGPRTHNHVASMPNNLPRRALAHTTVQRYRCWWWWCRRGVAGNCPTSSSVIIHHTRSRNCRCYILVNCIFTLGQTRDTTPPHIGMRNLMLVYPPIPWRVLPRGLSYVGNTNFANFPLNTICIPLFNTHFQHSPTLT